MPEQTQCDTGPCGAPSPTCFSSRSCGVQSLLSAESRSADLQSSSISSKSVGKCSPPIALSHSSVLPIAGATASVSMTIWYTSFIAS